MRNGRKQTCEQRSLVARTPCGRTERDYASERTARRAIRRHGPRPSQFSQPVLRTVAARGRDRRPPTWRRTRAQYGTTDPPYGLAAAPRCGAPGGVRRDPVLAGTDPPERQRLAAAGAGSGAGTAGVTSMITVDRGARGPPIHRDHERPPGAVARRPRDLPRAGRPVPRLPRCPRSGRPARVPDRVQVTHPGSNAGSCGGS